MMKPIRTHISRIFKVDFDLKKWEAQAMADSRLVKDVMFPAVQLEAKMSVVKALKSLDEKNAEFGVFRDVTGEPYRLITREQLLDVKPIRPIRVLTTEILPVIPIDLYTTLESATKTYNEHLMLHRKLIGLVVQERDIIRGVLFHETIEKQAAIKEVELALSNARYLGTDAEGLLHAASRTLGEVGQYLRKARSSCEESMHILNSLQDQSLEDRSALAQAYRAYLTRRHNAEQLLSLAQEMLIGVQERFTEAEARLHDALGIILEVERLLHTFEDIRNKTPQLLQRDVENLLDEKQERFEKINHLVNDVFSGRLEVERLFREKHLIQVDCFGQMEQTLDEEAENLVTLNLMRLHGTSVGDRPKSMVFECRNDHNHKKKTIKADEYNSRNPPRCEECGNRMRYIKADTDTSGSQAQDAATNAASQPANSNSESGTPDTNHQ